MKRKRGHVRTQHDAVRGAPKQIGDRATRCLDRLAAAPAGGEPAVDVCHREPQRVRHRVDDLRWDQRARSTIQHHGALEQSWELRPDLLDRTR